MMSQIENVDHSAANDDLSDDKFIQSCQLDIEAKSPVERTVRVTVPESLLKDEFESTMALTASQVALPGFRRGRVPKRVLEKRFGDELRNEFLNTTIRRTLEAIIAKNNFHLLGQPAVEPQDLVLPHEGALTFTLFLEIVPEIPLPDLTSIELARPRFNLSEERIGKAFEHLRRTMGVMRPQTGPIEADDQTFIKGEVQRNDGSVVSKFEYCRVFDDDYVSDFEIPGIKASLRGKSVGDTLEMKFKAGPKNGETIQPDEELVLKGEIVHNSRLEMPEINEEFATSNGFESVEELRSQMTEAMTKQLDRQAADALRNQFMESLEKIMKFPLPPRFLDAQLQLTGRQEAMKMIKAGVDEKLIRANSKEFLQACRLLAESICIRNIILRRLSDGVNVEVSRDEVMQRLLELSEKTGENPDAFIQRAQVSGLMEQIAGDIRSASVLDQFIQSCNIRDVSEDEWNEIVKKRNAEQDAKIAEMRAGAAAAAESAGSDDGEKDASGAESAAAESSASDAT